MSEKPEKKKSQVEDEPGAEDRFMRGVTKALNTKPKPFTPPKKTAKPKKER